MVQPKTVVSPQAGFGWIWHIRGMSGSKADQRVRLWPTKALKKGKVQERPRTAPPQPQE